MRACKVHFNTSNDDGTPRVDAALVIAVHTDTCVTLQTCNPWGTWTTKSSVSEGTSPGSWMWPPRA